MNENIVVEVKAIWRGDSQIRGWKLEGCEHLFNYRVIRTLAREPGYAKYELTPTDYVTETVTYKVGGKTISVPARTRIHASWPGKGEVIKNHKWVEARDVALENAGWTIRHETRPDTVRVENDKVMRVSVVVTSFISPDGEIKLDEMGETKWVDVRATAEMEKTKRLDAMCIYLPYGSHRYGESRDIDLARVPLEWLRANVKGDVIKRAGNLDYRSDADRAKEIVLEMLNVPYDPNSSSSGADIVFFFTPSNLFEGIVIDALKKDYPGITDIFDFPAPGQPVGETLRLHASQRCTLAEKFPINFTARKAAFAVIQHQAWEHGLGFINTKSEVLAAAELIYGGDVDHDALSDLLFGDPDAGIVDNVLAQLGVARAKSDKYVLYKSDDMDNYVVVHAPTGGIWWWRWRSSDYEVVTAAPQSADNWELIGQYLSIEEVEEIIRKDQE